MKRDSLKQLFTISIHICINVLIFLIANYVAYYIILPVFRVISFTGKIPIYTEYIVFGLTYAVAIVIMIMTAPNNIKKGR